MCRLLLYAGPVLPLSKLITEPEHSLIHQSTDARLWREPLNGDGFGMAWYVPSISEHPARFRSVHPAWSSANLREIARVSASGMVLAHVRAATGGLPVTETNCHPFLNGHLAFMHNGSIADFARHKRAIQQRLSDEAFTSILGSTDSEHLFALAADALARASSSDPLTRLGEALESTIAQLVEITGKTTEPSYLNLVISDGHRAAATRFATAGENHSLHLNRGRAYVCENGACRMVDAPSEDQAFLIASEPLSGEASWEVIPENSLVLLDPEHGVTIRPLTVTP